MPLSPHFFAVAALAVMTNGMSLLGQGQHSAGALVRALESRHEIAQAIQLEASLKRWGQPPCREGETLCDTVEKFMGRAA